MSRSATTGSIETSPMHLRNLRHLWLALAVMAAAAPFYLRQLDSAPPHIQIDEALIAINAQSIAATGRDLGGTWFPLYTRTAETSWYQPIVIYASALALAIFPFAEWSVRLPTVIFGLLDIGLMAALVHRWFRSIPLAILAAAMLTLTPGHFIHSRYGMDYVYPVAFILGWLLCLVIYREQGKPWQLVLATATLGLGFYCYISSIVLMPLYFLFTLAVLYESGAPRRAFGHAAAGFFPLLLPFAIWLLMNPEAYGATVAKYGLYDSSQMNAAQGLRSSISFLSVGQRLSLYWNYFDPSLLFFGSGIKVQFSTNLVGVFLLPMAVFMVAGMWSALLDRRDILRRIVLLGFVTAPLAAVIPTEENAIFRALGLLPFGVLLAMIGVQHLWQQPLNAMVRLGLQAFGVLAAVVGASYAAWTLASGGGLSSSSVPLLVAGVLLLVITRLPDRTRQLRLLVAALVVAMPIQFNGFWSDYFTSYRERVSFWLGGNVGGALETLINKAALTPDARIVFTPLTAEGGQLDWRNGFIDPYWRFYLLKRGRLDLLERTMHVDNATLSTIPPGSLVLANLENTSVRTLAVQNVFTPVETIPELGGRSFFTIVQR